MRRVWIAAVLLFVGLAACCVPLSGQDAASTATVPRLVLHLRWDASAKRTTMELVAHFRIESLDALKARMRPIARERVDPTDDFSEVPITIIADREGPFRDVQRAMAVCADPDVRIYRVRLEPEREPTSDGGRSAPPTSTKSNEPSSPAKFAIRLTMQNGKCRVVTNGWPIGDLPAAREVLVLQLQRAASLGMSVTITTDRDVPQTLVDGVADTCTKAKVPAITFLGAPPATPQDK
jgi:hypothetical protein